LTSILIAVAMLVILAPLTSGQECMPGKNRNQN
jgi:hypothetical protein